MALFNRRKEEQNNADIQAIDTANNLMMAGARMRQEDQMANKDNGIAFDPASVIQMDDGATQPYRQKIGREQIREAYQVLMQYKTGKANLEANIVENEQWFKQRHWTAMRQKAKPSQVEPTSGWLFNAIANKHADVMDNFPAANILPREEADKAEAKMLSSVIPVVLDQAEFEATYDEVSYDKLNTGTGVYGVFWDSDKLNGLGDIAIKQISLLSLFWEPGIEDIQKSRNLFHVELIDNDALIDRYPQLAGTLSTSSVTLSEYVYDDTVDTSNKSAVIDWYYKRKNGTKTVLHYCKFVNDTVLYATENEEQYAMRGWYDDGNYPFVFDTLFPAKGTPCGFGYIDVAKDVQAYIDRTNQAVQENVLFNARPRYFISNAGVVNEDEFLDATNPLVHVDGNLGQDSILPMSTNALPGIYVQYLANKVDELKEITGNRDISTGGTASGVTAASAIAAMQEAGSKLSRDNGKASYRAFRKIILMVIERIRQFYDLPRTFRILGENGSMQYIMYSNQGIRPQSQGGVEFGVDMGYRLPIFDVEVTAQKQSPYSKMAQNELALQFYNAGFFNPAMFQQALLCLEMMDFDRKDVIMQRIAESGMQYQMAMAMMGGAMGEPAPSGEATAEDKDALGGDAEAGAESSVTKNARQRTAEATAPR